MMEPRRRRQPLRLKSLLMLLLVLLLRIER
jgi:hypothetical protein